MKNKFRSTIMLMMTIIMCIGANIQVYAISPQKIDKVTIVDAINPILRSSKYIAVTTCSIGAGKNGEIGFDASVETLHKMDKIMIESSMLQKKSGFRWVDVKGYTKTNKNDNWCYYSAYYAGTIGKEYRLVSVFKVEINGDTETRSNTSETMKAKK